VVEDDMLAAENVADKDGERWLREVSPDDLPAWCAAFGQLAGVWSPVGLAAASVSAGLRSAGPSWESYTPAELVALAIGLRGLAALRLRVDGPPEPEPMETLDARCGLDDAVEEWLDGNPGMSIGPGGAIGPVWIADQPGIDSAREDLFRPTPKALEAARKYGITIGDAWAADPDGPIDERWLVLVGDDDDDNAEAEQAPDLEHHGAGPMVFPNLNDFKSMDKRDRIDLIRAAVGMRGLWGSFEALAEQHGLRHTKLNRWGDLSLTSLYGHLTG
jgi:hypothetical protein